MFNKDALMEALKELLRVVILAILPVLISALDKGYLDIRIVWTVAGLAALRFIDKYLHEVEPSGKSGGLTKF